MLAAHKRGLTQRAIAQEFGLSRKTVRRFLQATEFPEQAPRRRRTGLEPYREYLEKRWAEGCHNASRLCRELQQRGYTGERSRVREFVQPWRTQEPKRNRRHRKLPGLRLIAFWLAKPAAKRKPAEQKWVEASRRAAQRWPRQNVWRRGFATWSRITSPVIWIPGYNLRHPRASKNSVVSRRAYDVIVRPSPLALSNPGATYRLKGKSTG